jgi:hypothetical protein
MTDKDDELNINLEKVKLLSRESKEIFERKISKYINVSDDLINVEAADDMKKYCKNKKFLPNMNYVSQKTVVSYYSKKYFQNKKSGKFNYMQKPSILENEVQLTMNSINHRYYTYILKLNFNQNNFNKLLIDYDWINACNTYICNLSDIDKFTLYGYTHKGDEYVNMYLRKKSPNTLIREDFSNINNKNVFMPLFFEYMLLHKKVKDMNKMLKEGYGYKFFERHREYVKEILLLNSVELKRLLINYNNRLSNIIKKSPALTQTMVLFRGSRKDYLSQVCGIEAFTHMGYISASINYEVARQFTSNRSHNHSRCCFMVMTLLPGTRLLPMTGLSAFDDEMEFLINTGSKMIVNQAKDIVDPRFSTQCAPEQKKKTTIIEIVIG